MTLAWIKVLTMEWLVMVGFCILFLFLVGGGESRGGEEQRKRQRVRILSMLYTRWGGSMSGPGPKSRVSDLAD